ncbi:MAG: LuxR C-terminal-related transcriptional regulator [Jatrophihabitantaceae bacterium]
MPGSPTVVIIEDDNGSVAMRVPRHLALDDFVCVGSVNSITRLIHLASRGATVLNQAAPILVLLELVHDALLAPPPPHGSAEGSTGGDRVGELTRRRLEVERLARLTPAENQALRGLVAGLSATEIATRSHHSVHTIRSQIKAILTKLEVRTQVSAVAITHRSAQHRWLYAELATFTNFGDDPTSGPRQP